MAVIFSVAVVYHPLPDYINSNLVASRDILRKEHDDVYSN